MNSPNKEVCSRCEGFCCKHHVISCSKMYHQKMIDYWKIRIPEFNEDDIDTWFYVPQVCEHLNDKGLCDNYKDRPAYCREWPHQNEKWWAPHCELMRDEFPETEQQYRIYI